MLEKNNVMRGWKSYNILEKLLHLRLLTVKIDNQNRISKSTLRNKRISKIDLKIMHQSQKFPIFFRFSIRREWSICTLIQDGHKQHTIAVFLTQTSPAR